MKAASDQKIILVGNAKLKVDHSKLIDSCDIVIRFNDCPYYGGFTGHKIDILAVANIVRPLINIITKAHTIWYRYAEPFTDECIQDLMEFDHKIIDIKADYPTSFNSTLIPSTGFLAYLAAVDQFPDYQKLLVGFTWQGWDGHDWKLEKSFFETKQAAGLVRIVN